MSKSSQIEYSECMTLVTMVVTIYMCEYCKIYTDTKTFPFVFVPFPFHFCSHSFHAFLFSCHFPFTSFHVPSISVNHILISRSSYWNCPPFLLLFFMSFWCSSNFPFRSSHFPPFILLSCHFSFLPFSFKSCRFPCMSCHFSDLGHHGGHNLYVWILKKYIHRYKNMSFRVRAISLSFLFTFLSCVFILLSVSFHFLPCSFHFHQSYLCFTFILFNVPPFLLFLHVLLMFLWFPFPFVSFSFSSFFHVPFILLSCHFSFLPFFLQVMPCSLYVLSF